MQGNGERNVTVQMNLEHGERQPDAKASYCMTPFNVR